MHELNQEWHRFRADPPGERFLRHYRRAHVGRTTAGSITRLVVGPLLILLGVVLWFLPGPGWFFIFAGLTTLAGGSQWLARWLDRIEVAARRRLGRVRAWWTSRRQLS
jgi:hypothetical protein